MVLAKVRTDRICTTVTGREWDSRRSDSFENDAGEPAKRGSVDTGRGAPSGRGQAKH